MKAIFKWTAIAVAAVFFAFIAINFLDEDLDPRAVAYGKPRAPAISDAENGYYAMLAMGASDGSDGMAHARAWLAEVRAAAREGRAARLPESKQAKRPELCDPREASCLGIVAGKSAELEHQLAQFKEDLARYEALIAFKRFEEVLDYAIGPQSDLPAYQHLARAQRAYLIRIASYLEAGRVEEAITALERELEWQRVFLTQSRLLVSKMVAVAGYWRNLVFITNLLDAKSADLAPFLPRLQAMLKPLDDAVRAFPRVMETEFAFTMTGYGQLGTDISDIWQEAGWYSGWKALLYKPNATINHAYRYYSTLAASVLDAPAYRVIPEWESFAKIWHDLPWWRRIYNPVGKVLLSVAMPDWHDYPLRVHDLDALNRLVAVRAALLAAGVTPEQVPAAIAKTDARLHDPYTRKPMAWDAVRKRIYFEPGSVNTKKLKAGVQNGRVFVSL